MERKSDKMGSRGASSGTSHGGKSYGSEYYTVLQSGNIKFVKNKGKDSASLPQDTMTNGRVYAVANKNNEIKGIGYYGKNGKLKKQIDVNGKPHEDLGRTHVHLGYEHASKGSRRLTYKEQPMLERVVNIWNYHSK